MDFTGRRVKLRVDEQGTVDGTITEHRDGGFLTVEYKYTRYDHVDYSDYDQPRHGTARADICIDSKELAVDCDITMAATGETVRVMEMFVAGLNNKTNVKYLRQRLRDTKPLKDKRILVIRDALSRLRRAMAASFSEAAPDRLCLASQFETQVEKVHAELNDHTSGYSLICDGVLLEDEMEVTNLMKLKGIEAVAVLEHDLSEVFKAAEVLATFLLKDSHAHRAGKEFWMQVSQVKEQHNHAIVAQVVDPDGGCAASNNEQVVGVVPSGVVDTEIEVQVPTKPALYVAESLHPFAAPAGATFPGLEMDKAETDELSEYLLALDRGMQRSLPHGYRCGHGLVNHAGADISIRCPAFRVASPTSEDIIAYHYTHDAAFCGITGAWGPKHLRASFGERAHFGDGIYATRKSPGRFGSKDAVLLNNYTNALDLEKQEAQIKEWRKKGVADYCIPLVVPRSMAVDVMCEKTKEMRQAGYTARHNQPIRPDRDIIVIILPEFADNKIFEDMKSMFEQCTSADFCTRLSAVEALGKEAASGDADATSAVIKMLEDTDHNVRSVAVWSTACATSLTPDEAMSQLAGLANDPVKEVQCHVEDALKFLELAKHDRPMDQICE